MDIKSNSNKVVKFICNFIITFIIVSVTSIAYDLIISNKTFLEIDFLQAIVVGAIISSMAGIFSIVKE